MKGNEKTALINAIQIDIWTMTMLNKFLTNKQEQNNEKNKY